MGGLLSFVFAVCAVVFLNKRITGVQDNLSRDLHHVRKGFSHKMSILSELVDQAVTAEASLEQRTDAAVKVLQDKIAALEGQVMTSEDITKLQGLVQELGTYQPGTATPPAG